jgi:hypothetical protein
MSSERVAGVEGFCENFLYEIKAARDAGRTRRPTEGRACRPAGRAYRFALSAAGSSPPDGATAHAKKPRAA